MELGIDHPDLGSARVRSDKDTQEKVDQYDIYLAACLNALEPVHGAVGSERQWRKAIVAHLDLHGARLQTFLTESYLGTTEPHFRKLLVHWKKGGELHVS